GIGSWVALQIMSAALAPHCWKATSFAVPEYMMDFRSPSAFCPLAMTVFASCAIALPHRNATQIATTASFFIRANPPLTRDRNVSLPYNFGTRGLKVAAVCILCGLLTQM